MIVAYKKVLSLFPTAPQGLSQGNQGSLPAPRELGEHRRPSVPTSFGQLSPGY
jgi:hypothetical protein